MPAYMLFIREEPIEDEGAMAAYRSRNRGADPVEGMKPLVVYGETEAFEGEAPDGMVIIEFPDRETAKKWYFSDAYQEATKLRRKGAPSYRALLVDGWVP